MSISSPQPAVFHLFTIFRQIGGGELRIPAFQRGYVWKDSQVIDLLNSVREQFPIGSILLWHVDARMLELAQHEATAFPDVSERFPTSYVLDGMQRLSTLYGVFHFKVGDNQRFNVSYDLRRRAFYSERDIDDDVRESSVQISALLSPRRLLERQAALTLLEDGDALINELLELQATFQDYMIPVVTIRSQDINRIVGIFERTNSTGTRLDTVDFMRAITWDQSFDLNRQLDVARSALLGRGYELDDETIIKCVGMLLDVEPTSKGLLSLRTSPPAALQSAFNHFPTAFGNVTSFLLENFNISSLEHVPYEGQILVLFKAVGMDNVSSSDERAALIKWFWATGFNESLRGKPDHYVVRAINDWRGLIAGQIRGLEPRLKLTPRDFVDRRMIKGRALSSAFAAMFAANRAIDLCSGREIYPAYYMHDSSTMPFETVLTKRDLEVVGLDASSSVRLFANLVVTDYWTNVTLGADSSLKQSIVELRKAGRDDILESQFIDEGAADALLAEDFGEFLFRRAFLMGGAAVELVQNGRLDWRLAKGGSAREY